VNDTRECRNCKRRYPLSDFAVYHAGGQTGYRRVCKRCKYFQDLAWMDDHKAEYREKRAAYMREYRKTHKQPTRNRKSERLERAFRKL
jgi:hypothetical protein